MEKMPKLNIPEKWGKKSWKVHKIVGHIFNMYTIIMQSLNKKEWILLVLQITQTGHPLSIWDWKNV